MALTMLQISPGEYDLDNYRREERMKLRRAGIALLCVVLVLASGCGKREKSGAKIARTGGGRLVIGMQQEPEILNEAVNSMVASVYVCNLIFSKFVKYNDRLELVPDLIEEIPTVENAAYRAIISPTRIISGGTPDGTTAFPSLRTTRSSATRS